MQGAQHGVEHRVTEPEWAGEERTRLLRSAVKRGNNEETARGRERRARFKDLCRCGWRCEAAGERGVLLSAL